jgi:hypothetical protein
MPVEERMSRAKNFGVSERSGEIFTRSTNYRQESQEFSWGEKPF